MTIGDRMPLDHFPYVEALILIIVNSDGKCSTYSYIRLVTEQVDNI